MFRNTRGVIEDIGKDIWLGVDGRRLKIDKKLFFEEAKKTDKIKKDKKQAPKVSVQKPQSGGVKLDLHGYRVEEALEELDKFISDALLAGFEEILVYHGIGTGRLAAAVREYLKTHKGVAYIKDAPMSMGGYGATLIHL
jgi:DNA mismatch repair protein MutS2